MAFCILRMKENSAIKVVITRKERHVDKIEYKLLKRNITIVLKIFFRSETIYKTSTFEFMPTDNKDENGDLYYELKSEMIEDKLDNYFIIFLAKLFGLSSKTILRTES